MKYLLIGLIVLILLGVAGFYFMGRQSANGSAPGLQGERLAACPSSPNCACSEDGTAAEQSVSPLPLDSWAQLPALITSMGGVVTRQEEGYLAAEFTSSTFKFVDDVEFRRAEDAVHVRSASRVGYSDAGVNSARVAALRAGLSN
ncbi:MAG: DUF1499 domain-containing protein [Pseudomonadota bacterium]